MLILLMLALSGDTAMVRPVPDVDRPMVQIAPVVDQSMVRCDRMLMEAEARAQAEQPLLDRRRDDGQVRKYLLLDRRDQNGCPLPISYPVPDQPNALGRNLLAPDPVARPRSGRPAR